MTGSPLDAPDLPDLPAGYRARALTMTDVAAVTAVVAAEELFELGEVVIEEADYVSEWQRSSFDLASQAVGIVHTGGEGGAGEARGEGTIVAFAQVERDRGDAAVHPDHRRRGLGTALARWMRESARRQGATVVGAPCPVGSAADVLLDKLGYRVRWESWVLELLDGAVVPERPLPEGYAIREATPEDYPAAWQVTEDAFLEWSARDRESYEDYVSRVTGRPGFAPWNLRVVTDPAGEVVAAAYVTLNAEAEPPGAYIAQLATRRDQRNRGLAQALLVDAFAVARSHGAVRSELSTDSRTGALTLYEKVGMTVTSRWVNRAIDLPPEEG